MPNLHSRCFSHTSQNDLGVFRVYMATSDHSAQALREGNAGRGMSNELVLALPKRKNSTADQDQCEEGREGQGALVRKTCRGRPVGSRNKPKPPTTIIQDSANSLRLHRIEIPNGCNVIKSLANYARKGVVCILSATGTVTNITLRVPEEMFLEGRFGILSLSGTLLPPPAPPTELAIIVVDREGKIMGGKVARALIASSPIIITAAFFLNATFDRLEPDDNYQQPSERRIDLINMPLSSSTCPE